MYVLSLFLKLTPAQPVPVHERCQATLVDAGQLADYADWMVAPNQRLVERTGSRCGIVIGAMLLTVSHVIGLTGCSAPKSCEFDVVDYRHGGDVSRYRETFSEGYYDIDRAGNMDLVLLREKYDVEDPVANIKQVIHIRTFWRSIPGVTVAHRTQINGKVSYFILSGELGQSFEGAGSVFFYPDRSGDTISGTLDLARLKPVRRLVASADLFESVDLSGTLAATRDSKRVQQIVHDMDRRFGPRPRYQP